jgi:PKD repeat protein
MRFFPKISSILFFVVIQLSLKAQTQPQIIGGVINKYDRILTIDSCYMSVTVYNASQFPIGSKVLIIQINGARMQESDAPTFGVIQSLKNSGKYEINIVDSVSVNTIFLRNNFVNQYAPIDNDLQLVTFPSYGHAVVNDTLKAQPFDGLFGGILAFEAEQITLNAPIIANGAGLRGAKTKSYDNCVFNQTYDAYYYDSKTTDNYNGGMKGESIVSFMGVKDAGRGPHLNGGGGGNNHKAGGGGGGQVGAGGRGGEMIKKGGTFLCVGKYPGLGGYALPNSSQNSSYLFFGGAGGAGHNRSGSNSGGGNGGGIILIKANSLEGNNKFIAANGVSAKLADGDGAGGAGAAGSIALQVEKITGSLTIEAKGGNGGGSGSTPDYDFGTGGGGGGGRIFLKSSTSSVSTNVSGGNAGINFNSSSTLGAEKGGNGIAAVNASLKITTAEAPVVRKIAITQQPVPPSLCEGDTMLISVKAIGPSVIYQWQVNKGDTYVALEDNADYADVKTATLKIKKLTTALNPYLYRCMVSSSCDNTKSLASFNVSLRVKAIPIPLFSYSITNNTVAFNNGTSNGRSYQWSFGDGTSDTVRTPTHTYALQDTYRIVLKATNDCGTEFYSTLINLSTQPKAGFIVTQAPSCPGAVVNYKNMSSDNARRFFWSLPGGTPDTSNVANPVVTYNKPGTFDARLVVENTFGRDTFYQKEFVRIFAQPKVDFTATKNGLTVNFLNNTANGISYLWNFGDGKTSTQVSPQHVYTFAGTYVIKLTAINPCGSATDSVSVTIYSLPTATIVASQIKGCTPMSVQYSGQNTSNITTWNWTFPGGIPATSKVANPRVTYSQPGSYEVSLTITNALGSSTVKQDTFVKVGEAPKATFTYKMTENKVEFFNTSTNGERFKWDFGDGTYSNLKNPPPHAYNRNGIFTAILLAENEFCSAASEKQIPIFFFTPTNDVDTEGGIKVFPNPTNGSLYVEFSKSNRVDYQLQVTDIHGKAVKNINLSKETLQEVDINSLNGGIYFLRFYNEKQFFVKKIVKM